MIEGIVLLLFWMVLLPFALGMLLFQGKSDITTATDLFRCYAWGMIIIFSLFELITVPVTFVRGSLTFVTKVWTGTCIALVFIGGICYFKRVKNKRNFKISLRLKIDSWGLAALALILFQVIYVVIRMHIDDDDAWYAGTAVAAYTTDTINRIDPYTGDLMSAFPSDYTLSPYPIFYAMLAKLTQIHPAILMHTVMPAILIPFSYMVYALLIGKLFGNDAKRTGQLMFFVALFNLFGNYSVRAVSTFLLFRIWQGKATLCNCLIPLTIYFFIRANEDKNWKSRIALFLCVLAGTMVSSMGVFLIPVLLAAMVFVTVLCDKKPRWIPEVVVYMLPCIVQFGIYYYVLR